MTNTDLLAKILVIHLYNLPSMKGFAYWEQVQVYIVALTPLSHFPDWEKDWMAS